MKIKDIKIERVDEAIHVEVNGESLDGVTGYKIISSTNGDAELVLRISIDDADIRLESLTS